MGFWGKPYCLPLHGRFAVAAGAFCNPMLSWYVVAISHSQKFSPKIQDHWHHDKEDQDDVYFSECKNYPDSKHWWLGTYQLQQQINHRILSLFSYLLIFMKDWKEIFPVNIKGSKLCSAVKGGLLQTSNSIQTVWKLLSFDGWHVRVLWSMKNHLFTCISWLFTFN